MADERFPQRDTDDETQPHAVEVEEANPDAGESRAHDSHADEWRHHDPEGPASAAPVAAPAAAPAASGALSDSVRAERERLQAERAARREARIAALTPAPPRPDPATLQQRSQAVGDTERAEAAPAPVVTERVVTRRSTDGFGPSLGLFLLRLVVAAILGVHGINKLLDLPGTTEVIAGTMLPYPSILAIVVGAGEVAIAIALVFGLLTRVAGLGVALVSGGALAFVLWGPWSPFQPGQPGFVGELELLLVAVGVLFLVVGAGGWSVDRGFRTRRAADAETAA